MLFIIIIIIIFLFIYISNYFKIYKIFKPQILPSKSRSPTFTSKARAIFFRL